MRPDTALLRCGDPFWVPSEGAEKGEGRGAEKMAEIFAQPSLVVRINRVGKAIQSRFAHRYYNEIGLGVAFTDAAKLRAAASAGLPWEAATCFDRSAAVSPTFLPKDQAVTGDGLVDLSFSETLAPPQGGVGGAQNGNTNCTPPLSPVCPAHIDEKIALVSRTMTLKMGDLIYIGVAEGFRVTPGDRIAASLAGVQLLDFQIK